MGEVFLHERNVAEEIPCTSEQTYPDQAADYVVTEECAVMHGTDAGHKGSKGADDGNEAAQEDGLVAMFFIKLLRLFHMFRLDQAIMAFQ